METKWANFIHNKKGKLYFTTLNYNPYYILHSKLFECMFCTLNYDPCYTLNLDIKFVILGWKIMTSRENTQLCLFSIPQKQKINYTFIILNYILDYTLCPKHWISIQVNSKLDVEVQSIARVIV